MASPTSARSLISPLLSALGIMSRNSSKDSLPLLHEFAHAKMPVGQFHDHLVPVCVINGGLKRAEAYYVSELRILKEPSKKLKLCHEYVVAVIRRTDGTEEEKYLAFERSIGDQPQDGTDPHPPHPDRTLEYQMFKEKREAPGDSENEDDQAEGLRLRQSLMQKAMTSTTSLDSMRKKSKLADDCVLVINRPYCKKDDKQVAVLRLQPPPDAVVPPEPSTPSSTSTTPRIRSRKLSEPTHEQDLNALHRVASGPSAITYVPRHIPQRTDNETVAAPAVGSSPRHVKRKWIYLYELVVIAYRLNRSKKLYRVFSKNCYWFAGMLIHVVRVWTDNVLDLRDGNRVSHLQPTEDILSWYDNQMGKWMNVIRVVKTPMNFTLEALVEESWAEKVRFEAEIVKKRLQHTKRDRERDEELRKAREDMEAERRAKAELQRVRDEERRKNEELQRVREEERRKNEEELQRVREEEKRKNEELQRVREEEKMKNEEELQKVREGQERDRKAREEAEQKMKLLVEYLKAGGTPPPELLAEIANIPGK